MPEIILVDTTLRDGRTGPRLCLRPPTQNSSGPPSGRGGRGADRSRRSGHGHHRTGCGARRARGLRPGRVSAWNRLREADIRHSLDCAPHIIHLCCPISDRQIKEKLKSTRPLVLDLLRPLRGTGRQSGRGSDRGV